MEIVTTAGTGRRHLWRRDLMDAHYDPPGIEFVPADEHDHDTAHPVAECRKEVGEALCERHDTVRPLGDVLDAEDTADTEAADAPAADAGGDALGDESFDPWSFVEGTVDEVAAGIEAGDADGYLEAVRAAELAGKDRKGVHEVLDERAEDINENEDSDT